MQERVKGNIMSVAIAYCHYTCPGIQMPARCTVLFLWWQVYCCVGNFIFSLYVRINFLAKKVIEWGSQLDHLITTRLSYGCGWWHAVCSPIITLSLHNWVECNYFDVPQLFSESNLRASTTQNWLILGRTFVRRCPRTKVRVPLTFTSYSYFCMMLKFFFVQTVVHSTLLVSCTKFSVRVTFLWKDESLCKI